MAWREVIAPGSVKLSHVDGPYDMRKAPWDILTGAAEGYAGPDILTRYVDLLRDLERRDADLVAWYAPVLAEVIAASRSTWTRAGWTPLPKPSTPRRRCRRWAPTMLPRSSEAPNEHPS